MASDWKCIIPEVGTNKLLNPVAGTTGNYTAVGAGTNTQVTTYSYLGYKCHRLVGAGDNQGVYFTLATLANAIHYMTLRIHTSSDITVFDCSLDNAAFTEPTLLGTEGSWWVYGIQFPAAEATGSVRLYIQQKGAFNIDLYIGHIQVEQNTYATTPITGYVRGFCADGYFWNGAPHASTSTRAAKERSGGREVDLETTYNFKVRYGVGLGMPPVTHHTQGMALLPGALYQGHKVQPRALDLVSTTMITAAIGAHKARSNFINACKPDRVSPEQPTVFRYYGANASKPVEFYGYYDSGMEFSGEAGKIDQPVARFICYDPYCYEVGEGASVLTSVLTASYFSTAAKIAGVWTNQGPVSAGGDATCALLYNGVFYVSMSSLDINAIAAADYVAKWTGTAWAAIGASGFDNTVVVWKAAPDGTFWAGGQAHTMVGTNVQHIGKSTDSGATWTTAGGISCDGAVTDIVWDQSGNIYACGDFSLTPDNHAAVRIMTTANNGTHWTALAGGVNVQARAMAISPANELYVVGDFTTANGVAVNYIARWTGATFATVGGTSCDWPLYDLCFDPAGNLYICSTAMHVAPDGTVVYGVAKWNGKAWFSLGLADGSIISKIWWNNGLLYATGTINTPGGTINNAIAVYNGSTWHALDLVLPHASTDMYFTPSGDIYLVYSEAAAANLNSSAVTTVTNNGSTIAFPEVHIKRSGGTSASVSYLKNVTTGATLWLSYDLLDGEELTIRTQPTERTITSSFFGTVWRAILRESDFSEFNLMPGANVISLFVLPVGAPTVTAWMQYRVTHWSADTVSA